MAAPRVATKPKPAPVKATPGAKAAALQQAAANKTFAAQQAARAVASQRTGYKDPATGRITIQTRGGITKLAPKPAPTTKSGFPVPPARQKNPIEQLLTPGAGGIANAMKGGAERKKGVLRP